MKAMILEELGPLDLRPEPLRLVHLDRPRPSADEILVRVSVCGVCHTELDEIEGRTPPPALPVVPGHEAVGVVVERGARATRHELNARVGIGWIHHSTGHHDENLSPEFRATGRDADGGYAEYLCVHENYAYPIPACFSDAEAAPLLCAGSVGYRALRLTGLENGQVLGLTGFGGSGHIVLQLARFLFPKSAVFVFARSETERGFAIDLGAQWAGSTEDPPPELPHAIIDTTPAWLPVLAALKYLKPGGRLIINAIRKEDHDKSLMRDIDYSTHLWQEKELKTVANVTAADISEFLEIASRMTLRPEVELYPLERANEALRDLRRGHLRGAKVLQIRS